MGKGEAEATVEALSLRLRLRISLNHSKRKLCPKPDPNTILSLTPTQPNPVSIPDITLTLTLILTPTSFPEGNIMHEKVRIGFKHWILQKLGWHDTQVMPSPKPSMGDSTVHLVSVVAVVSEHQWEKSFSLN